MASCPGSFSGSFWISPKISPTLPELPVPVLSHPNNGIVFPDVQRKISYLPVCTNCLLFCLWTPLKKSLASFSLELPFRYVCILMTSPYSFLDTDQFQLSLFIWEAPITNNLFKFSVVIELAQESSCDKEAQCPEPSASLPLSTIDPICWENETKWKVRSCIKWPDIFSTWEAVASV